MITNKQNAYGRLYIYGPLALEIERTNQLNQEVTEPSKVTQHLPSPKILRPTNRYPGLSICRNLLAVRTFRKSGCGNGAISTLASAVGRESEKDLRNTESKCCDNCLVSSVCGEDNQLESRFMRDPKEAQWTCYISQYGGEHTHRINEIYSQRYCSDEQMRKLRYPSVCLNLNERCV